jgi:hypothetical protein
MVCAVGLAHTPAANAGPEAWWAGFDDAQLNRVMVMAQGLQEREAAVFNQVLVWRISAVRLAIGQEMLMVIDREQSWLHATQDATPDALARAARLQQQTRQLWAMLQRLRSEHESARSTLSAVIVAAGQPVDDTLKDTQRGLLVYQADSLAPTTPQAPGGPPADTAMRFTTEEQLRMARAAEQTAQRLLLASRMQWEASRIRFEAGQQPLPQTLQDHLQMLLQADDHAVASARLALAWQQLLQSAKPADRDPTADTPVKGV